MKTALHVVDYAVRSTVAGLLITCGIACAVLGIILLWIGVRVEPEITTDVGAYE